MKAFTAILTALSVPIFALNALGGIVSGIWLICLGQWRLVVGGLLVSVFGTWVLSLAMIPAMGLLIFGTKLAEKGKFTAFMAFVSLASLWQYILAAIWCIGVFFTVASHATDRTFIAAMILAYGVAIAPWAYMAQGENDGSGAMMLCSISIGCLAMLVFGIIGTVTRGTAMETFYGIMICGYLAQTVLAMTIRRASKGVV